MNKFILYLLCGALLIVMTGCTSNIATDNYSTGTVGSVNSTVSGVVVSVRQINVSSDDSGNGKLIGGAAGAVAGSAIGGGTRMHALGAIAGATLGAIAGNAAERGLTHQQGLEYVIRTDSGRSLSVVQGTDVVFQVGQRVRLIYGKRARLVAE